jgi:hypothetical protein
MSTLAFLLAVFFGTVPAHHGNALHGNVSNPHQYAQPTDGSLGEGAGG